MQRPIRLNIVEHIFPVDYGNSTPMRRKRHVWVGKVPRIFFFFKTDICGKNIVNNSLLNVKNTFKKYIGFSTDILVLYWYIGYRGQTRVGLPLKLHQWHRYDDTVQLQYSNERRISFAGFQIELPSNFRFGSRNCISFETVDCALPDTPGNW